MHEAVLEDRLRDVRNAAGARHKAHELRLQVGREAGEGVCDHINRLDAAAVAINPDPGFRRRNLRACAADGFQRRIEQARIGPFENDVTAGHGHGHRIGAGFDAVGQDPVACARKGRNALDGDGRGAGARNLCAHGVKAIRQIDHFRLACGIADRRRAVGERRRHHHDMRRADGDFRENVARADEPACGRRRIDVAAVDLDVRAKCCEAFDEQVDRPRADGAAARQRNAGLAFARQKRADDPEARPHLGDELIRRCGVDDVAAGEVDRAGIALALPLAPAVDGDIGPVIAQDADQLLDIGQMRHVLQRQRIVRQERCDHQRQGGVLGAGNRDDPVKLVATGNSDAIHDRSSSGR